MKKESQSLFEKSPAFRLFMHLLSRDMYQLKILVSGTMKAQLSIPILICSLALFNDAGSYRKSKKFQVSSRSYGGGGGGGRGGGSGGNKISAGTQCTLVKQQGGRGGGSNCFNEQECAQQCSTFNEQQCSTVNEQQCSTVNEQQCSTVNDQQCHNVLSQECSTVSEQQCNSVPSQECSTVNKVV